MDIRPDIQIQSMIKAMVDVVLPAVDPDHKMAQEQARLIIGTLQLVAKRLPVAYRYDCDELRRYIGLAVALVGCGAAAVDQELKADIERLTASGTRLLERPCAEPVDLERAAFELRAVVSQVVQAACTTGSPTLRQAVRRLVLDAAKVELERERALVIDMGFETDPSKRPPPIEQQLPPATLR